MMAKCEHEDFIANVNVTRLEDSGRFAADVRIQCTECETPFRFIGLPAGCDLNGASTSMDATEARLAIAPKGEVMAAVDGAPHGFSVRIDPDCEKMLPAIRINKLESDIAELRLTIAKATDLAIEADGAIGMLCDAGFVGTSESLKSKVAAFIEASRGAQLILSRHCPVCHCEFETGQPPDFKAEESGMSSDGERMVHWVRGTQTCPECGATWPYGDSD